MWITAHEQNFFEARSCIFDYSRVKLMFLYAKNYDALRIAIRSTANAMKDIHIDYLGNYPLNSLNKPVSRYNYPYSWENTRELFNYIYIVYLALPLIACLYAVLSRNNPLTGIVIFLAIFVLTQYIIVIIGDGFFEHGKHLFLAKFAFDLILPLSCGLLYLNIHQYRVGIARRDTEAVRTAHQIHQPARLEYAER